MKTAASKFRNMLEPPMRQDMQDMSFRDHDIISASVVYHSDNNTSIIILAKSGQYILVALSCNSILFVVCRIVPQLRSTNIMYLPV